MILRVWACVGMLALGIACKTRTPDSRAAEKSSPPHLAVESFQAAWEMIRDTHFDTNFNGLDWEKVRADFLPKIEAARSQEEVRETMQEMLDLLDVSHLMVIAGSDRVERTANSKNTSKNKTSEPSRSSGETGTLGIEVRPIGHKIVIFRVHPNSPAERVGIKPGWLIEKIDGEVPLDPSAKDLPERQRAFHHWRYAADLLKGAAGEKCVLEFSHGAKTIVRGRETGEPAKLGNLPTMFTRVETNQFNTSRGKKVGYLTFNLWMVPAIAAIDRFVDANRNADAIVIDMRGNVGGIGGMVMGTSGHFVNRRASLGKMTMRDNELNFVAIPRRVDTESRPTNTFQGKLAILTDAISLSSAELFAGGMQELGRARVFGEQTGGQALPAVSDRLPNGDLLYHAVADFTTPKGRRLEENGVVPDEIVPLRIEALRAGRDEVLDAALRWIDSTPQPRADGVK